MRKIIFIIAVVMVCFSASAQAVIKVVPKGTGTCPNKVGQCNYYELFANFLLPGSAPGDQVNYESFVGSCNPTVTLASPTQYNVAAQAGVPCVLSDSAFMMYKEPGTGMMTWGTCSQTLKIPLQ